MNTIRAEGPSVSPYLMEAAVRIATGWRIIDTNAMRGWFVHHIEHQFAPAWFAYEADALAFYRQKCKEVM
jgi:hypothetical protein